MFKFKFILFLLFAVALHNQLRNGDVSVLLKSNPIYSGVVVEIPGDNTKLISFNQNGENETLSLPNEIPKNENIPYSDENNKDNSAVVKDNTTNKVLKDNVIDLSPEIIDIDSDITKSNSITLSSIDFNKFDSLFSENDSKIIGCIRKDAPYKISTTTKQGNCFLPGGVWMNIALPPRNHIYAWRQVFGTTDKIINALPVVNLESSFNAEAKLYISNGKYYNKPPYDGAIPFVQGYVQTKYSYGISTNIVDQLSWMKRRMDSQISGNCSQWANSGEKRLFRCLYARHHGDLNGYNWYPSFNIAVRDYYISYFTNYAENNITSKK